MRLLLLFTLIALNQASDDRFSHLFSRWSLDTNDDPIILPPPTIVISDVSQAPSQETAFVVEPNLRMRPLPLQFSDYERDRDEQIRLEQQEQTLFNLIEDYLIRLDHIINKLSSIQSVPQSRKTKKEILALCQSLNKTFVSRHLTFAMNNKEMRAATIFNTLMTIKYPITNEQFNIITTSGDDLSRYKYRIMRDFVIRLQSSQYHKFFKY